MVGNLCHCFEQRRKLLPKNGASTHLGERKEEVREEEKDMMKLGKEGKEIPFMTSGVVEEEEGGDNFAKKGEVKRWVGGCLQKRERESGIRTNA